jgi:hypothetical protein
MRSFVPAAGKAELRELLGGGFQNAPSRAFRVSFCSLFAHGLRPPIELQLLIDV